MLEMHGGADADADALSATFFALSDPTRRAILKQLLGADDTEVSVAELAQPFSMTPRAVSNHVRILEQAGLVTRSRDAQRRPSRIRLEPLAEVDRWLEEYRSVWNHRFARLAELLADEPSAPDPDDAENGGTA